MSYFDARLNYYWKTIWTFDDLSPDGSEEKGSNKVKKGVRENGESPTALDKAKLIAEKALEVSLYESDHSFIE